MFFWKLSHPLEKHSLITMRPLALVGAVMEASATVSIQKGGGKEHTKVIKMVKSDKSGSYTFKEEIVHNDKVKEWFTKT